MDPDRLRSLLRARRRLLCQVALLDTAIAAESGACAYKTLDPRLAEPDDPGRGDAACDMNLEDLLALPAPAAPLAGEN